MDKVDLLDKLHLSMSFSAVGHEFSINELTMYIKLSLNNRNTHKKLYNDQQMKIVWSEAQRNLT